MALSPKQQAFVDAYLVTRDGTKAAIAAGYAPKSARVQAAQLLARPNIAQAVVARTAKASAMADVSETYVLANLKECVERCMQRAPVMTFSPVDRAYVQAQDDDGNNLWQFDSKGAIGALNLIGKHLGMFKDRVEHTGADGAPLTLTVTYAK